MKASRRNALLAAAVLGPAALSLGSAALAETYEDPLNIVSVGTNGSEARSSVLAVGVGGCAEATVAVAVGESRSCGTTFGWPDSPGQDAIGIVALGVLGADANANGAAVSDTGDATTTCWGYVVDNGCWAGVAVSGSGPASGRDLAVSGTGTATSSQFYGTSAAISGTGNASASHAASGTGDADGVWIAVAPDGSASATNGVAVSATGDADGGLLGVSVLGDAGRLTP